MRLFLVLLLIYTVDIAHGLYCYRCDHNQISTTVHEALDDIFRLLGTLDEPTCFMNDMDKDRFNVDVVECPPTADEGMRYVCGTVKGDVSILEGVVKYETIVRDCVQVPAEDPKYENRCEQGAKPSGPVHFLIDKSLKMLRSIESIEDLDSKLQFTGRTCYQDDVGLTGEEMMCPACSFSEMESDTSGLAKVLEVFQRRNDRSCLLQAPDDAFRIGQRICPSPSTGKVARCGVVKGTVSATYLERLGEGLHFRFKTLDRGCIEADPKDAVADKSTGCEDGLVGLSAERLVESTLTGINAEDIDFKGTTCYNLGLVSAGGCRQGASYVLLVLSGVAALVAALLG